MLNLIFQFFHPLPQLLLLWFSAMSKYFHTHQLAAMKKIITLIRRKIQSIQFLFLHSWNDVSIMKAIEWIKLFNVSQITFYNHKLCSQITKLKIHATNHDDSDSNKDKFIDVKNLSALFYIRFKVLKMKISNKINI